MESKYAKFERFLGRIFIVLISILLTVVAFELGYRFIKKTPGPMNFTRISIDNNHVQKPYVMFTAKPNPSKGINALGYLGELPSKIKPKNEFRIFFLGGSVLYFGTNNFVKLLRERVSENVKIFNFGIPSSVSRQELIRVLLDIAGYEPDLIVSFSGYNDLYDTGWDPRINYPHRYILFEANPALKSVENYDLLAVLGLKSLFVRDHFSKQLIETLVKDMFQKKPPERDQIRQLIADAYIQNLRLTNVISDHLGAKFISFFQPVLFFKECFSPSEQVSLETYPRDRAKKTREAVTQAYKSFQNEFEFHDLSDLFKGDCTHIFSDYVHFYEKSSQEKVINHILPLLEKKISESLKEKKSAKNVSPRYFPEEIFTF